MSLSLNRAMWSSMRAAQLPTRMPTLHWAAEHFFKAHAAAIVISDTYRQASQEGCSEEDAFGAMAPFSDSVLAGKHFSCRSNNEHFKWSDEK
jgi:hypothetical protein